MPLGLSLCSSGVNSGTSTADTSMVTEAGSSGFTGRAELLDAAEVALLRLRGGGLVMIPPPN
ncbi:hypothetical protein VB735_16960 [Halotia wernerae UHCC 0503]|nr:hypothetical protein [Halotia wernerae UHCC 0503]